jgi:hypothetical protein
LLLLKTQQLIQGNGAGAILTYFLPLAISSSSFFMTIICPEGNKELGLLLF